MVGNCASVQVSCARRMRTWAVVPEAANSLLRSTVAVPLATERPSRSANAGTCEPTPASDSARFGPASSACTAARAGAAVSGCWRFTSHSLPLRWNQTL